jgi:hypothetical protein
MHSDAALFGEMFDELRVLGSEGRRRNSGGDAVAGVRQAVTSSADRPDQGLAGNPADSECTFWRS